MVERSLIQANILNCLTDTDFLTLPGKRRGKVRDTYDQIGRAACRERG